MEKVVKNRKLNCFQTMMTEYITALTKIEKN